MKVNQNKGAPQQLNNSALASSASRTQPDESLKESSKRAALAASIEDFQEQIEEDPDVIPGEYFFPVTLCPKTVQQANVMVAKVMDAVIEEDSELESEFSRSQTLKGADLFLPTRSVADPEPAAYTELRSDDDVMKRGKRINNWVGM